MYTSRDVTNDYSQASLIYQLPLSRSLAGQQPHYCFDLLTAGLLKRKSEAGKQTTLEATLIQRLPASDKDTIKKLQKQATSCWWQPGHPGWAIWPVDTQTFLQDMAVPVNFPILD